MATFTGFGPTGIALWFAETQYWGSVCFAVNYFIWQEEKALKLNN